MQNLNEDSTHAFYVDPKSYREPKIQPQDPTIVKLAAQKAAPRENQLIGISSLRVTAFAQADWELALINTLKKGNRYQKEVELGMMTDIQQFHSYGPGVSLFFYFQKYLIFALLFMSVLSLIPVIFNYFSGSTIVGQGSSLAYFFGGTTIGNLSTASSYSNSFKLVNTIVDMVNTLIFIVFYFFWLKKGSDVASRIKNMVKLKCYTVIELTEFAKGVSSQDVKSFMSRFGSIVQIAAVKNYKQMISLSKDIYDLEIQLKSLQIKKQSSATNQLDEKIAQIKQKIDQHYSQIALYDNEQAVQNIKFYINFASIQERQNSLKQLQQYSRKLCICCQKTPDQFLLKGQRVTVRPCHTEPTDILWQNQHVDWSTRWLRVLIQSILLLIVLALSFLTISFLNILLPASTTSISTSSYTSTTILSETNTTIIQSWCITNQISILQSGSSSTIYNFCWTYIYQNFLKILITIGISISIVIIKYFLKLFVLFLSRIKRYKTQSEQSRDIVLSLFLVYLATTVLITFLLQAYILGISFKNLIQDFLSNSYLIQNSQSLISYEDFASDWYLQIGYQIAFNCFTMIIHPALTMPPVLYLLQKYSFWKAKKEQVQANMEKLMQPAQFQIQSNYADLLVIIFIGLAFSGGAPIITIICFFAVTFRYLYFKHLFYRYCKIPKAFDQALDNLVAIILPFGIFIHFVFSIWMFGVTSILKTDTTISIDIGTSSFMQSVSFIFQRLLGTYYYSIFFILYLLIWFFKTILYNFLIKLIMGQEKRTMTTAVKVEPSEATGEFVQTSVVTSKSLCDSYKIQNNPDYIQVLQIMKKRRKLLKIKQAT